MSCEIRLRLVKTAASDCDGRGGDFKRHVFFLRRDSPVHWHVAIIIGKTECLQHVVDGRQATGNSQTLLQLGQGHSRIFFDQLLEMRTLLFVQLGLGDSITHESRYRAQFSTTLQEAANPRSANPKTSAIS